MNCRVFLMLLVVLGIAVLTCVQPLCADPIPGPQQIVVRLTGKDERVVSDPAASVYDFGRRDASDETAITRVFLLQNKTGRALTIDLLRPSCGCIIATIKTALVANPPYALKPGASVPIQVSFAPELPTPGPIEKDISVFVHGQNAAAAVLQIKGVMMTPAHPS